MGGGFPGGGSLRRRRKIEQMSSLDFLPTVSLRVLVALVTSTGRGKVFFCGD